MITSLLQGTQSFSEIIIHILMRIPAVLIAISVHEAAHGYASYKLGDPTAKLMGRVTINPLKHFDIFGVICMLLVGFGWAKPVPFDVRCLKHPKRDTAIIAAAGPVSNFLIAVLFTVIYCVLYVIALLNNYMLLAEGIYPILLEMIQIIVLMNLSLMIFNFLPIPPLDGSKIVISFLPYSAYKFVLTMEKYGMSILMIWLLISDRLPNFISITYWISWLVIRIYDFITLGCFDIIGLILNLFV